MQLRKSEISIHGDDDDDDALDRNRNDDDDDDECDYMAGETRYTWPINMRAGQFSSALLISASDWRPANNK